MNERKRRYSQTRRAESAAETRRKIIEAARECLTEGPLRAVSMDEIAKKAGVARSTVNLAFGNRHNLMMAVAEDALERGGYPELVAKVNVPDAVEALRGGIDVSSRGLFASEYPVVKALLSLAGTDGDAADAAFRLQQDRHGGMVWMAKRLREEGYLHPDVSEEEAIDVLFLVTSIEAFILLYEGRQLKPEQIADRLMQIAERTLGFKPLPSAKTQRIES